MHRPTASHSGPMWNAGRPARSRATIVFTAASAASTAGPTSRRYSRTRSGQPLEAGRAAAGWPGMGTSRGPSAARAGRARCSSVGLPPGRRGVVRPLREERQRVLVRVVRSCHGRPNASWPSRPCSAGPGRTAIPTSGPRTPPAMIPAAGSQASADADAEDGARDRRDELAAAGDQPHGEPAHRGREDDVEAEPLRLGDAPADRHADERRDVPGDERADDRADEVAADVAPADAAGSGRSRGRRPRR